MLPDTRPWALYQLVACDGIVPLLCTGGTQLISVWPLADMWEFTNCRYCKKSWTWTIWSLYLRGDPFLSVFSGIWLLQGVASTKVCCGCLNSLQEALFGCQLASRYSIWAHLQREARDMMPVWPWCDQVPQLYSDDYKLCLIFLWPGGTPNLLVVSSKTKLYSSK